MKFLTLVLLAFSLVGCTHTINNIRVDKVSLVDYEDSEYSKTNSSHHKYQKKLSPQLVEVDIVTDFNIANWKSEQQNSVVMEEAFVCEPPYGYYPKENNEFLLKGLVDKGKSASGEQVYGLYFRSQYKSKVKEPQKIFGKGLARNHPFNFFEEPLDLCFRIRGHSVDSWPFRSNKFKTKLLKLSKPQLRELLQAQ